MKDEEYYEYDDFDKYAERIITSIAYRECTERNERGECKLCDDEYCWYIKYCPLGKRRL